MPVASRRLIHADQRCLEVKGRVVRIPLVGLTRRLCTRVVGCGKFPLQQVLVLPREHIMEEQMHTVVRETRPMRP